MADPADLQGMPADAKPIPGRSEVLCYASMLQWPQDTMERVDKGDQAVADFLWNRFCHSSVASPGVDRCHRNGCGRDCCWSRWWA